MSKRRRVRGSESFIELFASFEKLKTEYEAVITQVSIFVEEELIDYREEEWPTEFRQLDSVGDLRPPAFLTVSFTMRHAGKSKEPLYDDAQVRVRLHVGPKGDVVIRGVRLEEVKLRRSASWTEKLRRMLERAIEFAVGEVIKRLIEFILRGS